MKKPRVQAIPPDRHARDWLEARDEEESVQDAWELTYADGSVRHECWKPTGAASNKSIQPKENKDPEQD